MKYSIVLASMLCSFGHSLLAQMEPGKFSTGLDLGGTFSNNNRVSNVPKDLSWSISPNISQEYFLFKNGSIVLGFGYAFSSSVNETYRQNSVGNLYTYERNSKRYTISPWIGYRKYWFSESGKFALSLMPYGRVNYNKRNAVWYFNDPLLNPADRKEIEIEDWWVVNINADFILSYFITPGISFELASGLFSGEIVTNRQSFRLGVPTLRSVGVRYYY